MIEVETILEAISNLDKKVSDRLNGLEAQLSETIKNHNNLVNDTRKNTSEIQSIKETLKDLINSDALIRKEKRKYILNKESVYDRFEQQGLTRHMALKLLDDAGLLAPHSCGCRTQVAWDGENRKAYRVIVIKL